MSLFEFNVSAVVLCVTWG